MSLPKSPNKKAWNKWYTSWKCITLNEFERQNEPWPGDETDVDEPGHVAEHPQGDQFDVTDLADDFHAVEVGHHLTHVVDNRSNAKKCRWTSKIL